MTEPSERIVLQAYRTASEALDEAPAQEARAAILAAAARASGARPRPIGRPPRWRLPLAAAASVLVGTIAVLLATQVERQRPVEQAETVAAASPAPPPTGVAGAAGEATPSAAPPLPAAASPTAPKSAATAPPRRERETAKSAAVPMQEASVGETAAGSRAEAAPAAAADSVAPAPAAPAPPVAAAKTEESAPPQADAAPSAGVSAQAPARSAARLANDARADAAAPWRAAPESWVEKIVKLRAEGRHDEADKELAALRARHPDLRLPPAALPAAGR